MAMGSAAQASTSKTTDQTASSPSALELLQPPSPEAIDLTCRGELVISPVGYFPPPKSPDSGDKMVANIVSYLKQQNQRSAQLPETGGGVIKGLLTDVDLLTSDWRRSTPRTLSTFLGARPENAGGRGGELSSPWSRESIHV